MKPARNLEQGSAVRARILVFASYTTQANTIGVETLTKQDIETHLLISMKTEPSNEGPHIHFINIQALKMSIKIK